MKVGDKVIYEEKPATIVGIENDGINVKNIRIKIRFDENDKELWVLNTEIQGE